MDPYFGEPCREDLLVEVPVVELGERESSEARTAQHLSRTLVIQNLWLLGAPQHHATLCM